MTESVFVLDPGKVTGSSLWLLDRDAPVQRVEYQMIHGGMDGFISFMEVRLGPMRPDLVICEQWNVNDGRQFGDPTEPLRIEGAIATMCSALGIELVWQKNDMKALCSDETLKEHGLYIFPKDAKTDPAINWTDARDVNDTALHMLAWAKASGHEPTIDLYWPDR